MFLWYSIHEKFVDLPNLKTTTVTVCFLYVYQRVWGLMTNVPKFMGIQSNFDHGTCHFLPDTVSFTKMKNMILSEMKVNESTQFIPILINLLLWVLFFSGFPWRNTTYIYIYVYNIIQHIITSSLIRFPRSAWISQTKIGRQIMFERIQAMDQKRLMFDEFSDMFNERVSMARISWIIYYIYYINNIYKYMYIYIYVLNWRSREAEVTST